MMCVWWAVLVIALGGRGLPAERQPDAKSYDVTYDKSGNTLFTINGTKFKYNFIDGEYFDFECPRGITLDGPLPRFETALQVREVRLACPLPAASYKTVLSALNVIALNAPSQNNTRAPPTYSLTLVLRDFDATVLAATPALRNLSVSNTELSAADLALLPAGLMYLTLSDTKISRVPANVLARLPALVELIVDDGEPATVEAAGNLSSLSVTSPSTLVSLTLPDSLERLHLWGWAPVRPEPWRSCSRLESLRVYKIKAVILPDGWLARCGHLGILKVLRAENLRTLAAGVLRGATALEDVAIWDCSLEALPAGLFDDARALRILDLGQNFLHTLPSDLFRFTPSLSELNLIDNKLDQSVLGVVGAVTSLNILRLGNNPALDACTDRHVTMQGSSPLRNLKNLTLLSLSATATTRVCPDWGQFPRLQELSLYGTNTSRLTYADIWFNNTGDITVGLDSMNLSLSREDFDIVAAAPAIPSVTLHLWNPLRCDCELYWAAAMLRRPNNFMIEHGARCEDRRILYYVPLDEFVCPAPDVCPDGCSCTAREDVALPGRVLKLNCSGAGQLSLPRIPGAEPFILDLNVADNRIYRLSPDDLPPGLLRLDLRGNSLGLIDNATASALVSRPDRRVFLADNPLECDCRAAAALATMRDHPDIFPNWANATCSNGTALSLAMPQPCDDGTTVKPYNVTASMVDVSGMSGGAVAALVVGVAAAAALVTSLVWRSLRRRLTVLPSRLPPETYTGEWLYDAFVSFAHADEAIAHELVERLEGGAEPFRLCVHYRDWMPGGWIPAQIAASVRVSRRTVAVVSEAYLCSKWTRAEFREAYAAAVENAEPRLVLVFLEDPSRLSLDAELRSYVAGNTYVCWGDPWFWEKLRRALPDPLLRQSDESNAHASPNPLGITAVPPSLDSEIELASMELSAG